MRTAEAIGACACELPTGAPICYKPTMRKWMQDKLKRRKKTPQETTAEAAPLHPAYSIPEGERPARSGQKFMVHAEHDQSVCERLSLIAFFRRSQLAALEGPGIYEFALNVAAPADRARANELCGCHQSDAPEPPQLDQAGQRFR